MPKEYNIPRWYSPTYERLFLCLEQEADAVFAAVPVPAADQLFISSAWEHEVEVWTPQYADKSWPELDRVSPSSIVFLTPQALAHYLPHFVLSATKVLDAGRSAAEDGWYDILPYALADSATNFLTANKCVAAFTSEQLSVCRLYLELASIQQNKAATAALRGFWGDVGPPDCAVEDTSESNGS